MTAQQLFDEIKKISKEKTLEKITLWRNSTSELEEIFLVDDKLCFVFSNTTFGDIDSLTGKMPDEIKQSITDAYMSVKTDLLKQIKEQ